MKRKKIEKVLSLEKYWNFYELIKHVCNLILSEKKKERKDFILKMSGEDPDYFYENFTYSIEEAQNLYECYINDIKNIFDFFKLKIDFENESNVQIFADAIELTFRIFVIELIDKE